MKAIILIFCLLSTSCFAWTVVKVVDADTIYVADKSRFLKLRLWGIDAPEKAQRFGKYCSNLLRQKILRKNVRIQIKASDKYHRKVARVYLNDEDINKFIIDAGCAWAYTYYTKEYLRAQNIAKSQKRGLWQDVAPKRPSVWRKEHPRHYQHSKASGYFQQAVKELYYELAKRASVDLGGDK